MSDRPFVELETRDKGVHLEVCGLDVADDPYVDRELVDVASCEFSLPARLTRCQADALIAERETDRAEAWWIRGG